MAHSKKTQLGRQRRTLDLARSLLQAGRATVAPSFGNKNLCRTMQAPAVLGHMLVLGSEFHFLRLWKRLLDLRQCLLCGGAQ